MLEKKDINISIYFKKFMISKKRKKLFSSLSNFNFKNYRLKFNKRVRYMEIEQKIFIHESFLEMNFMNRLRSNTILRI